MGMKADITDIALFEYWLKENTGLAKSTIKTYIITVKQFLVTDPDIDIENDYIQFLVKTSIKKSAYHNQYALIKYLEWKLEDKNKRDRIIETIKNQKIRLQDRKKERQLLTDKELIKVINNLQEKHKVIALLQMFLGSRVGDILRLKREDVFFENDRVKLSLTTKGSRRETVHIFNKVVGEILTKYMNENIDYNGYIFLELGEKNLRNRRADTLQLISYNYFQYWESLKQALTKSGFNKDMFSTHTFRQCFSRKVWDRYHDIDTLQRLLRHTTPTTTLRYLRQSALDIEQRQREIQTI